jgi:UDP-3-O-[3-hydroxymyristoyl] glucosamine N-acyltransferase
MTGTQPLECRKTLTVAELVAALPDAVVIVGDAQRRIACVTPVEAMCRGSLSFVRGPLANHADRLASVESAVIIAPLNGMDALGDSVTLIKVAEPREYFIRALHELIGPERLPMDAVSSSAIVASDARIGAHTSIGPGVIVASGAVIGDGSVLYAGVQILDGVELGAGVVVQANAVIGAHGQSYTREADGRMLVMPHYGRVVVGARTRIGANATIVRGTLRDTVIGCDTSIGNNVNIGHNAQLGSRCFVGPAVVLTGSSVVGDDAWISAGAIVCGVTIGRHGTVGAGSVVTRSVDDHSTVNGVPARPTASRQP